MSDRLRQLILDRRGAAAGLYMYRMKASDQVLQKKMTLLK